MKTQYLFIVRLSNISPPTGGPALLLTLALSFGAQKYDPSLLEPAGKELQFLFSTILVVMLIAVCIQWQFASFGTIYNGEFI